MQIQDAGLVHCHQLSYVDFLVGRGIVPAMLLEPLPTCTSVLRTRKLLVALRWSSTSKYAFRQQFGYKIHAKA